MMKSRELRAAITPVGGSACGRKAAPTRTLAQEGHQVPRQVLATFTCSLVFLLTACERKKPPNIVNSPVVEWLPAATAASGSWNWVLNSGGEKDAAQVNTVPLSNGNGLLLATRDGQSKRGTGLLPLNEGLLFGVAEVSEKGETQFQDAFFFKFPAAPGESYDMNEYLMRAGQQPLKVDGLTKVEIERLALRKGGTVEALVYELKVPPYPGAEVDYAMKWYWLKGAGLIRMENVSEYGGIVVTEGYETERD